MLFCSRFSFKVGRTGPCSRQRRLLWCLIFDHKTYQLCIFTFSVKYVNVNVNVEVEIEVFAKDWLWILNISLLALLETYLYKLIHTQ